MVNYASTWFSRVASDCQNASSNSGMKNLSCGIAKVIERWDEKQTSSNLR